MVDSDDISQVTNVYRKSESVKAILLSLQNDAWKVAQLQWSRFEMLSPFFCGPNSTCTT